MIKNLKDIEFDDDHVWAVAYIKDNTGEDIDLSYDDVKEIAIPEYSDIDYSGGKKVVVSEPIFNNYIFIKIKKNSKVWHYIETDKNVRKLLTGTGKGKNAKRILLPIKKEEIDGLMESFNRISSYEVGSWVEIKSGMFSGFKGKILSINGMKIRLSLEKLNHRVEISVDKLIDK